jgi:uncharacterized protein (TIGR02266 family)
MRGTGRATPAAGLPAVRHGVPAPGASAFSGTHPRVRRPQENEAVVSFAPDADERARVPEQKLADVENELREVRRERDDLERRLHAALEELAGSRATVRPPQAASTESSATRRIDPLGATFVQTSETPLVQAPLVQAIEAPLAPGVEVPTASKTDASVTRPIVSAPPIAPSIRSTPSHGAELSRLVVSTRPAAPSDTLAPPSSGAERRQKERRECEFDVEFLGDSHFITGITQDLSEGGVFVATYQRLPIGTPVCLAFELPDGHRVEARGEVRWIRGEREESGTRPGLGIAFTELDAESLAKISAFCGSLPARYYEF